MKRLQILAFLALPGCVTEPPPPSPAAQALTAACQGGNLDACAEIERIRLEEARIRASTPVFRPTPYYNNPADFQSRHPMPPVVPHGSPIIYCAPGAYCR
jgi:hypothetical protein